MRSREPFFDGTYWDFCVRIAPDCFRVFPDGAVDVDFDKLNEKRDVYRWENIRSFRRAEYTSLETVHIILENILPPDILTEYTVRLEDGERERLRTGRLVMDDPPETFDSAVKCPLCWIRGRAASEEQTVEAIRIIEGVNGVMNRYPTFLEQLAKLLEYQKAFPFLDFVAAVAWPEENPRDESRGGKARRKEVSRQYLDFPDRIMYGIRLDGSSIEFWGRDRTVEAYRESETFYGDPGFSIYI